VIVRSPALACRIPKGRLSVSFFSNEGDPPEPIHVHVRKAEKVAKFWVDPIVALEESFGMTSTELRRLQRIVEEHQELIREHWHEHFGD